MKSTYHSTRGFLYISLKVEIRLKSVSNPGRFSSWRKAALNVQCLLRSATARCFQLECQEPGPLQHIFQTFRLFGLDQNRGATIIRAKKLSRWLDEQATSDQSRGLSDLCLVPKKHWLPINDWKDANSCKKGISQTRMCYSCEGSF